MTARTKRKYVEKEVLYDYSLPTENQSILKIIKSRGSNLHQVMTSTGDEFLASMPPKFRKHIWIKRGDFVVTEPIVEGNKVKAEIVRILTRDLIKYYVQENVWPESFLDAVQFDERNHNDDNYLKDIESDDEGYLVCNPNKPKMYYGYDESSSEEEDSSEEEESQDSVDEDLGELANLKEKCSIEDTSKDCKSKSIVKV